MASDLALHYLPSTLFRVSGKNRLILAMLISEKIKHETWYVLLSDHTI